MSDDLKDIITKLLDKNPATRLGSKNDAGDIVNHPWFAKSINFDKLLSKQIVAPFKPDLDKMKEKKPQEEEESKVNECLLSLAQEEKSEEISQDNLKLIEKHKNKFKDF